MRTGAGYILYVRMPEGVRYLLLRNARHGTWGFPKGHLDEGEDLHEAALRELREETGIQGASVHPDFEAVLEYEVEGGGEDGERVPKRVHLFLARAEGERWERSKEHDEGGWMPAETALARLQHADLKDALLRAMSVVAAAGE